MNIKNCKMCSRLFQATGGNLCPACVRDVDDMYIKVRDYIYDHDESTIAEVSKETGVDETLILQFLKEGRLEFKTDCVGLSCERCDKSIRTGRFCPSCADELAKGLKEGLESKKKEVSNRDGRLFIADRIR